MTNRQREDQMLVQAIHNGPFQEKKEEDPRPEEVKLLASEASKFADMYKLVKESHFPALGCKVVDMLMDHLGQNYKKAYNELCSHPWVVQMKEEAEKLEKERQAKE